jgi:hypothetical protein
MSNHVDRRSLFYEINTSKIMFVTLQSSTLKAAESCSSFDNIRFR